ncbi:oxidative stress defense protein, partial [Enterobacter cloacae]
QESYEQPTIQFDDQVDVVFQLEPTQTQQTETAKAQ